MYYGAQNLVTATFVQTPIWLRKRKIFFCLIFAQMEVPANIHVVTGSKYIDQFLLQCLFLPKLGPSESESITCIGGCMHIMEVYQLVILNSSQLEETDCFSFFFEGV